MCETVDFTYPVDVGFECSGCGLCCGDTAQKKRHILLLAAEARKISAATHLSIRGFAKKTPSQAPYVYEMRKQKGKCFFLKNCRCSIYGSRPLICQFYPFELRFNPDRGKYVFNYTLECLALNKENSKRLVEQDFEKLFLLAKERLS